MTLNDSNNYRINITINTGLFTAYVCLRLSSRTSRTSCAELHACDSQLSVYGEEQVCRFTVSGEFFHQTKNKWSHALGVTPTLVFVSCKSSAPVLSKYHGDVFLVMLSPFIRSPLKQRPLSSVWYNSAKWGIWTCCSDLRFSFACDQRWARCS